MAGEGVQTCLPPGSTTMGIATSGYATAWMLLILAGVANIAGYAFDLYQPFWWFDRVLHGCTILAITFWLAIVVFGRFLRAAPPQPVLAFFLLASVGIAIGALWEVAEWGFDLGLAAAVGCSMAGRSHWVRCTPIWNSSPATSST